jgi:hypothetical protein
MHLFLISSALLSLTNILILKLVSDHNILNPHDVEQLEQFYTEEW